jgi:hypothetical protein
MRDKEVEEMMLDASDRAGRGASIEVQLIRLRVREEEICFTFGGGMVERWCNALGGRCGVMRSQRGLGLLWEVWGRAYLLTRGGTTELE